MPTLERNEAQSKLPANADTKLEAKVPRHLSSQPPREINGPSAWYGGDMVKTDKWLFRLTKTDISEIDQAIASSRHLPIQHIGKAQFLLPKLGKRMKLLLNELLDGRGFVLIRGLPINRYDRESAARAYWGLGAWLGSPRSQNARGDLLGHVIDLSRTTADPTTRIYQTSERQNYHADPTDIVGLLCLQKSMVGGASSILSSVTLYNEFQKRRPDLAAVLLSPFCIDRRGEVPKGKKPWYQMSVFSWHAGLLTTQFTRPYIDSAQRFSEVPRLTPKQVEALDFFQALCEEPSIHLKTDFEPGDIQFLHNYQILHDRTAFIDWPGQPERKRHLLRLWLCTERGRNLPSSYRDRQGRITVGDRGGIIVPDMKTNVTIEVV